MLAKGEGARRSRKELATRSHLPAGTRAILGPMSKFTAAEKADIIATARKNVERPLSADRCRDPGAEDRLERWRKIRKLSGARTSSEPMAEPAVDVNWDAVLEWLHERIARAVAAERAAWERKFHDAHAQAIKIIDDVTQASLDCADKAITGAMKQITAATGTCW